MNRVFERHGEERRAKEKDWETISNMCTCRDQQSSSILSDQSVVVIVVVVGGGGGIKHRVIRLGASAFCLLVFIFNQLTRR